MEKKYDVLSFGEAMVRFTAPDNARLEQASWLEMAVSATELSVAVNTSRLGLKTAWVSKLVDTWSGHYIINKGREHGVDMSNVKLVPFDGVGRIRNGFSFFDLGVGPRANRQIYDRAYSAISLVQPGDIDWQTLLPQTKWFHTTGITTALSDNCVNEVITALKTAKEWGVKTSFDLNFRATLWKAEKAQQVMKKIMPYIDVLIGNEEHFEKMLGIKVVGSSEKCSKIDAQRYISVVEKVMQLYPNVEIVGTSLRDSKTALLNDWQTVMFCQGQFLVSRKYENLEVIDRTGAGDSFASGLIFSLIKGKEPKEAIEFSAAYSALCHGFRGDWNWATIQETERVMRGCDARVIR
jgi:2-dehydro-3-deoxygluconokinase